MTVPYTGDDLLELAEDGLREIGYDDALVHRNYKFADVLNNPDNLQEIELAAHSQEPADYINASFGVAIPDSDGPDAIQKYRSLGAVQIFGLYPHLGIVKRWGMVAQGKPRLLDTVKPEHLRATFLQNRDKWHPLQVLRAKSRAGYDEPPLLDFYDAGLLVLIEEEVHAKLSQLLQNVDDACRNVYSEYHMSPIKGQLVKELYRLIFRLVAAKLLLDRGDNQGDWGNSNPEIVIQNVDRFYFADEAPETVLSDRHVQQRAWNIVRSGCRFQNISVEALAYVYENTFVTREVRKTLGTHATPPEIAEFVVRQLPINGLLKNERRVFEPFAGAAPFLIAFLKRLRRDLPLGTSAEQRHAYFVEMLSGMEIDSFAREIARYSLILADYPNPSGWRIYNEDVFTSPTFDECLSKANVVLCNPPYEDFSLDDYPPGTISSSTKAAEALRRVLHNPPKILGFVLPFSFVSSSAFRETRAQIITRYSFTSVIALPDTAFQHSQSDTALLIAYGDPSQRHERNCALVNKDDYGHFLKTGEYTWEVKTSEDTTSLTTEPSLWHTPLEHLWKALTPSLRLNDVAEVHRGIEYTDKAKNCVFDTPGPLRREGLQTVRKHLESLVVWGSQYLSIDPKKLRGNAHTRQWDKPKVIANAARISRGPWSLVAAVDYDKLICSQRFHGIWPTGNTKIEVIAAVLNGYLANAFITSRRSSRDNQIQILEQVPFPKFSPEQTDRILILVNDYRNLRSKNLHIDAGTKEQCDKILDAIDRIVLTAYGLPPALEEELVKFFKGTSNPGRFKMDVKRGQRQSHSLQTTISLEIPQPRSLWEIAQELISGIPEEEINNIPTDGSENVDRYLYGRSWEN